MAEDLEPTSDGDKSDEPKPGNGFLGWLGRQVGHVRNAMKAPVEPDEKPIYRSKTVETKRHPDDSRLILKRTTVDEVRVDPDTEESKK